MKSTKMVRRRNKIYRIISLLLIISISLFLIIYALRDNVIFFYSPSEVREKVAKKEIIDGSLIRLGGLVQENSFLRDNKSQIFFVITDYKKEISVVYSGILPDLFEEGQGVIAEGFLRINENLIKFPEKFSLLKNDFYFEAQTILAKHDENYMPPEVADALEMETNDYD
tara:strand:+ start:850 stop:1356 length:507 start_codon:yes stop_codon:yes gene_type:complete